MPLKKGKKAPEFSAINQNGETITSTSLMGKKTVLFFYPKDNTPTCTEEACNLRDNHRAFVQSGYQVIGVSPDSEKKHQNFINKFQLPYDLIADTNLNLVKAFKVWGPKKLYGREYMGVYRTTYIINEDWVIEEVIEKVEAKNHSKQILN